MPSVIKPEASAGNHNILTLRHQSAPQPIINPQDVPIPKSFLFPSRGRLEWSHLHHLVRAAPYSCFAVRLAGITWCRIIISTAQRSLFTPVKKTPHLSDVMSRCCVFLEGRTPPSDVWHVTVLVPCDANSACVLATTNDRDSSHNIILLEHSLLPCKRSHTVTKIPDEGTHEKPGRWNAILNTVDGHRRVRLEVRFKFSSGNKMFPSWSRAPWIIPHDFNNT